MARRAARDACPRALPGAVDLEGWFEAASPGGRSAPFRVRGSRACGLERVWVSAPVAAGHPMRVVGERRPGRGRGFVVADSTAPAGDAARAPRATRWRGALVGRVERLWGERAPVVSALVLARREGLDAGLREAFARTGIAHLLAISGFHVGVVAAILLTLARRAGAGRRAAVLLGAAGTWAYVLLLGFPDAATRAALILTLAGIARLRARPGARWAPLGAAFLVLVAHDPDRLAGPGFQLSFAGAAGLLAWRVPLARRLSSWSPVPAPAGLVDALAAGVAATAATLPVVGWHFGRVSLVGVPATLVASPLVALALPGALAALLLEPLHPGAAAFLAGGVDTLLGALLALASRLASLPWASVAVGRDALLAGAAGGMGGHLLVGARGRRGTVRRALAAAAAAASVLAWAPLEGLATGGRLELVVADVGQGDAIALRTPRGRWLLVDAGPPAPGRGPDAAVRALRRLGVRRLEAVVLTHADADHVGGAPGVLEAFEVGAVLDPGRAEGKGGYVAALEAAERAGVPWRRAEAGAAWELDGVGVEVLHPPAPERGERAETNDLSVVLLVRFGRFEALLTGDAPAAVERAVAGALPPAALELLKVGHHGSRTSTDSLLLARARPRAAVVSVGGRNRYGHPAPEVLARLGRAGVEVRRTDLEGTLTVVARRDGSFVVRGERPPPPGR